MLLCARALSLVPLAAMLAALLSERDLLRGAAGARDTDIGSRIAIILGGESSADCRSGSAAEGARRVARELARQLGADSNATLDSVDAGLLLAFAYPDRIGRRRAGSEARYTLANGRGAFFAQADSLSSKEFMVAVDLDDRDRDARILLAAALAKRRCDETLRRSVREHARDRMERPRRSCHRATRRQARRTHSRGAATGSRASRGDAGAPC